MTASDKDPIGGRLAWAVQIAREAGEGTRRHFRRADLRVECKSDNTPVTVADREAEELLRRRIAERFPQDAIVGEEFGRKVGTSGYQWAVDPIEGTQSFVHGVPLYTTLVAVLEEERGARSEGQGSAGVIDEHSTIVSPRPCIGVIDAPATGETVYAALGHGCTYLGNRTAKPRAARRLTSFP